MPLDGPKSGFTRPLEPRSSAVQQGAAPRLTTALAAAGPLLICPTNVALSVVEKELQPEMRTPEKNATSTPTWGDGHCATSCVRHRVFCV
ncbi:hypothetical protein GN956_G9468 [Arapaima gigas]